MVPFQLRYTLTRRQRLAVELFPWLPAVAGGLGFCFGAAFLVAAVSRWFLLLFLIPPVMYRGLFAFLFEIAFRAGRPVEVTVDEARFAVRARGEQRWHDLDGIIQVFRSEGGTTWTVLHLDGEVLTVPAGAITAEQLDYLKSFARRGAVERAGSRG